MPEVGAPKYLYRDYFKANVYTIWVHGPLKELSGEVCSAMSCMYTWRSSGWILGL